MLNQLAISFDRFLKQNHFINTILVYSLKSRLISKVALYMLLVNGLDKKSVKLLAPGLKKRSQ